MPIVTTSGNIGKVDLRYTPKGVGVLTVSVADERYDYKEKKNITEWVNAKWFGDMAEKLADVMNRAKTIVAIGQEQYRVHEGKLIREVRVIHHDILGWKPKKNSNDNTRQEEPIDISDDFPF